MSIPTWAYDASFYEDKTRGSRVYIKTDPVKGKGLFARAALKAGSAALTETALCCTQNRDDYLKNIPVCGMCLVSVESPRAIVARVTKNKTLASELPYAAAYRTRSVVRCKFYEEGCPMVFCSARCQEHAWESFHYAGCRGCMTEGQQAAHDQFITNEWQQCGVDYSDTHFLAMRFLASALTSKRLHKQSLEASYQRIAQLIKAPITKFNFSFLLRDDDEFDGNVREDKKQRVLWDRFLAFKDTPEKEPNVMAALDSSMTKQDMLRSGTELIANMFHMDATERDFYLGDRWSELLGAVLLNGQERTPHSPYFEHCEALGTIPLIDGEIRAFHKKLKVLGYNTSKLHCSSSGQGIYNIGCLFNHSCEPNLQVLYIDANDETLVAQCLRDIEADEELCISYINEALPYPERQQQLYEHYLFNCACTKCSREAEGALAALAQVVLEDPPAADVEGTSSDSSAVVDKIETSDQTVVAAPQADSVDQSPVDEPPPEGKEGPAAASDL